MPILNYERQQKRGMFPPWVYYWLKRLLLIGLLALVIEVGVTVIRARIFWQSVSQQLDSFNQLTSESKLLGKTPEQIAAFVGTPHFDTRADGPLLSKPEYFVIGYYGPMGTVCRIEITNGVATEVEHYGR